MDLFMECFALGSQKAVKFRVNCARYSLDGSFRYREGVRSEFLAYFQKIWKDPSVVIVYTDELTPELVFRLDQLGIHPELPDPGLPFSMEKLDVIEKPEVSKEPEVLEVLEVPETIPESDRVESISEVSMDTKAEAKVDLTVTRDKAGQISRVTYIPGSRDEQNTTQVEFQEILKSLLEEKRQKG